VLQRIFVGDSQWAETIAQFQFSSLLETGVGMSVDEFKIVTADQAATDTECHH